MNSLLRSKGVLQYSLKNELKTENQNLPICYDGLKELVSIPGLSDNGHSESTEDAHRQFMENYHKMFIQQKKPKAKVFLNNEPKRDMIKENSSITVNASVREDMKAPVEESVDAASEFNFSDHLNNLRGVKKVFLEDFSLKGRIKMLRKFLRIPPFERTAADNNQIYKALSHFSTLSNQMSAEALHEIAVVTTLEVCDDIGMSVFGNMAFHIILKGKVSPFSYPYVRLKEDNEDIFENLSAEEIDGGLRVRNMLVAGDSFGTLYQIPNANSKTLTVITLEPCEFVKISGSNFHRIITKMKDRSHSDKVALLQSNPAYKYWTRQSLIKVASIIEWKKFPSNTVLVSENFQAPFLAFIQKGNCQVLRQVKTKKTLPNGKTEIRVSQVVMGRLKAGESFGEVSVLDEIDMTCTIVSETNVRLGVIHQESLQELDHDTKLLLRQSSEPTFGHISQSDVEEEYLNQESQKTWNEFKHGIIMDVINARGIQPGHGKWAK